LWEAARRAGELGWDGLAGRQVREREAGDVEGGEMKLGSLLGQVARAAGLGLIAATPAQAGSFAVGDVLLCASTEGQPSVLAWIGRTERWADHGETGPRGDVVLVHLQIVGGEGGPTERAGHAPFEASALDGRRPVQASGVAFDPAAFEEGYATWREAIKDAAGAFTIGPADACWTMMGIRDGAME